MKKIIGADPFTDAALAEQIAEEALLNRFCHTKALGWLRWDGARWAAVDDDDTVEAVRQHILGRYVDAVQRKAAAVKAGDQRAAADAEFQEQGWHRYQSRTKLEAVVKLAAGIETIKRDASDFDRDSDVLNTPAGLLHLDTLELESHDPSHLVTRITAVDYERGFTHPLWKTALEAIPEDAIAFLQARFGQGITGHTPDDDVMMVLTGTGNNGKTIVLTGIVNCLGNVEDGSAYAQMIPHELLLTGGTKGAATPEKMELRGARFAYIEETPEDRYLSVNTLKQVIGTPIQKGRHLYKNTVTWRASHSVFINTNFPPKVVETDEASWRRLGRVDFPWRYRPLDRHGNIADTRGEWLETDRAAHPDLKRAVGAEGPGDPDVLRAALAWLVEGAHRWYAHDRSLKTYRNPPSVVASIQEWRGESDQILAFVTNELAYDPNSWISSTELHHAFCAFVETQNGGAGRHGGMGQTLFVDRLKRHTGLGFRIRDERKRYGQSGESRWPNRSTLIGGIDDSRRDGKQLRAIVGVRFQDVDDWAGDAP